MQVLPDFPEHRLKNPMRQAELAVYLELQASEAEGMALYEVRAALTYPELDAVVWLIGVGRFGLQVKGGHYRIERGVLYLLMPDGTEHRVGSVLKECWDATHERCTGGCRSGSRTGAARSWSRWRLFPDMAPDEAIEAWAVQAGVRVIWGSDHLVQRLVDMAATCRFFYPPTSAEAQEEVALVLGAAAPEHAEEHQEHEQHDRDEQHERDRHEQQEGEATEARQVHLHIDTVNIYIR